MDIVLGKKFFEYYNDFDKRKNIVFFADSFFGVVKLGGPEAKINSEENKYILEWHGVGDLKNLNIVPKLLKEKIIEKYGV